MKIRRHLVGIVAMLVVAMFALALVGCGAKSIDVSIDDNGTVTNVTVDEGKTVGDALEAADIELGDKDVVEPALDSKISESAHSIAIMRCAKVQIVDGGQTIDVELTGGTVAEALSSASIVLGEGDVVDVDLAAPLQDGMIIAVTRAQAAKPDASDASYGGYDGDDDYAVDEPQGRSVVSRTPVPDCADESHGYYEILYSDGSMEYEEY